MRFFTKGGARLKMRDAQISPSRDEEIWYNSGHHNRSGSENGIWKNDVVKDIGNLYLLSKSDNSSLNVHSPEEKVALAGRLDNHPPERCEMCQLTQAKGWPPEVVRQHSDDVLTRLGSFLSGNGSDRMFAGQCAAFQRTTTSKGNRNEKHQM